MKLKSFFTILLFSVFFIQQNYAEDRIKDSLLAVIKNAGNDSIRCNAKIDYSRYILYKDMEVSLHEAEGAAVLARKLKNDLFLARSQNRIGVYYSMKSNVKQALVYFDSALVIFTRLKNNVGLATTHLNLGECYENSFNNEKSLFHFMKALEYNQATGNLVGAASAYEKIGQVNVNMQRYDEALQNARKGLVLAEKANSALEKAKVCNIIGIVFDYSGQPDSALLYYNRALDIDLKLNENYDAAITMMNMGVIYLAQKKTEEAETITKKALQIMNELEEMVSAAACYVNLGEIYREAKKYNLAITNLDKGINMLDSMHQTSFLMEGLKIKSSTLKESGDFKNALEVFEQYTKLKDSIFNLESDHNLAEMQTKFQTKEKDVEIKLHQTESAKQKSINQILMGSGALVAVIAVLLVIAYRKQRKANQLVNLQKAEIERQKNKVDEAYQELNEKNKEVLDSIHYAKRIQKALMPTEKYIARTLKENKK